MTSVTTEPLLTQPSPSFSLLVFSLIRRRTAPDPDINEGRPCHYIPSRKAQSTESVDRDSGRIERGFKRFFYRHRGEGEEMKEAVEVKIGPEEIIKRSQAELSSKVSDLLAVKIEDASHYLKSDPLKDISILGPAPQADATVKPPSSKHEVRAGRATGGSDRKDDRGGGVTKR